MTTINFKGKANVQNHHYSVAFHRLEPDKKKSVLPRGAEPNTNGNMIIHGDNLIALKTLMPTHAGKINCIYIDPPYNTGNENWCYNDRVNSATMHEWIGKTVDSDDLTRHDKWCCMMYPRLSLLQELLAEDGVIFISIDDNEQHRLRMMMDEIFGEENFICSFVWEGTGRNDVRFVSVSHDYILCYAKNLENIKINKIRWRIFKQGLDKIYKHVEKLKVQYGNNYEAISDKLSEWYRGLDKKDPSWQHRHYNMVDEQGIFFPGDISWPGGGGPSYEVLHPLTHKPVKQPSRGWVFSTQARMQKAIEEGMVYFGKDHNTAPNLKRYLHQTEGQVLNSVIYKDRRSAAKQLKEILKGNMFENPKYVQVLKMLIDTVASTDAVILDSFAGSGTTAQAVLELNKEDNGSRKFVLIECENYADKVTAERVRRVIKGIKTAKDENLKTGLGGHFTYWKLGQPVKLHAILDGDTLPSYEELAAYLYQQTTGETWNPEKQKKNINLIGTTKELEIYLYYEQSVEYLKNAALTSEKIQKLPRAKKGKQRIVFAPCEHAQDGELAENGIKFSQLPYAIYRIAEKHG